MNKKSLGIRTFFAILFTVIGVGIISVPLISNQMVKIYTRLQADLNARQAREIAAFIEQRYQRNVPIDQIKEEVQALLKNSQSDRGFSCVVDQDSVLFTNHPISSLVGTSVSNSGALFTSETGEINQVNWEKVFDGENKKGILEFKNQEGKIDKEKTEIVAAYSLASLGWTVTTHENVTRLYAELKKLRFYIILIAIIIGITIAYPASFAARRVSGRYEGIIEKKNDLLAIEIDKSERLLLNILPQEIAKELKEKNSTTPQRYDSVTVLFADLVGFTEASSKEDAKTIVAYLNTIFNKFDEIVLAHKAEKIKTIGDAYMVAAGVPSASDTHAKQIADIALEMLETIISLNESGDITLGIRIGMHSGPVIAGVIGKTKFIYDLWGDTVNTASRMESTSQAGKIQVSEAVYSILKDMEYTFTERGGIQVKGKGEMNTYFLEERAKR